MGVSFTTDRCETLIITGMLVMEVGRWTGGQVGKFFHLFQQVFIPLSVLSGGETAGHKTMRDTR